MKKLSLLTILLCCIIPVRTFAVEPCYVTVENSASYEKLVVTTISLTMIRQFIDASVKPLPLAGASEKSCFYRVNVTEQADGVKVFLFGENISDYGNSGLRGEAGLERALLRVIYKGVDDDSKRNEICEKYGKTLEVECVRRSMTASQEKVTQAKTIPTARPGLFVYDSPAFSVTYPPKWEIETPEKMGEVLRIGPEGSLKNLSVQVNKSNPNLEQVAFKMKEASLKHWREKGFKDIDIPRDEQIKLKDGTSAHITAFLIRGGKRRGKDMFHWIIAAKKDDTIVSLHLVAEKREPVFVRILRSLTFY